MQFGEWFALHFDLASFDESTYTASTTYLHNHTMFYSQGSSGQLFNAPQSLRIWVAYRQYTYHSFHILHIYLRCWEWEQEHCVRTPAAYDPKFIGSRE